MDEFKPDNQPQGQNDLRPDTSDRPTGRSRQSSAAKPKFALSRQHIMIGVGIFVLLLLIIAISSALNAPTEHEKQQTTNNSQNIDLSGSSSLVNSQNQTLSGQPQEIAGSQITPTPTQGEPQAQQNGLGERIEIPGDVVDALNQGQVTTSGSHQPQNEAPSAVKPVEQQPAVKPVEPKQPVQPKQPAKPASKATHQSSHVMTASTGYTLQLSSASRSDTLEAFAKENKLSNYNVYKTVRNGKTWYVLIHGNYNSVTDAKNAIGTLPAAVQAKKPWVRNMKQVKQDQK